MIHMNNCHVLFTVVDNCIHGGKVVIQVMTLVCDHCVI